MEEEQRRRVSVPWYLLQELASPFEPLLPIVDAVYLMRMWDSRRSPPMSMIKIFANRVFIQHNMGKLATKKKPGVDCTGRDIIHSYKNVARHALRLNFKKVLILEDDVVFSKMSLVKFRSHLKAVDEFCRSRDFTVYSLGSFGFMIPEETWHRRFVGEAAFAHAMIWSNEGLLRLLVHRTEDAQDVDSDIMSQFPRRYTYYRPLAMQTFPNTQNSEDWCCPKRRFCIRAAGLDGAIEPGWSIIYTISNVALFSTVWCVMSVLVGRQMSKMSVK